MQKISNNCVFDEFSETSSEDWVLAINKELKGADFDSKMIWKTLEGINVKPFYRSDDLNNTFEKLYTNNLKQSANWEVSQEIILSTITKTYNLILEAIKNGADSISLIIPENIEKQLIELISKLNKTKIKIRLFFDCEINKIEILPTSENIELIYNIDYLTYVVTNNIAISESAIKNEISGFINRNSGFNNRKIISVNSFEYSNFGFDAVTELSYTLAIASEYLSIFDDNGIKPKDFSRNITFNFGISSNYFFEIAKLRAFRFLWQKLIEAYTGKINLLSDVNIHSITTEWDNIKYDSYNNVLRATTQAMSAVIGGANSVVVKPFDLTYKSQNEISNKISRNIQLILKDEAHLGKVIDIAHGSFYIESLTAEMIKKTWELFLKIEENGGFIKLAESGEIINKLIDVRNLRLKNISSQKETLLGVNKFPNINENPNNNLHNTKKINASSGFENLKTKVNKLKNKPEVFLLTFGNLSQQRARAFFASNFFSCANFKITDNACFSDINEGIKCALNSSAQVVTICSSDEEYKVTIPLICEKLKNKKILVLAGNPKSMIESYKNFGVQYFIHAKSDMISEVNSIL